MASTYKEDGIFVLHQTAASQRYEHRGSREPSRVAQGINEQDTTAGKEFNKTFYSKEMSDTV